MEIIYPTIPDWLHVYILFNKSCFIASMQSLLLSPASSSWVLPLLFQVFRQTLSLPLFLPSFSHFKKGFFFQSTKCGALQIYSLAPSTVEGGSHHVLKLPFFWSFFVDALPWHCLYLLTGEAQGCAREVRRWGGSGESWGKEDGDRKTRFMLALGVFI